MRSNNSHAGRIAATLVAAVVCGATHLSAYLLQNPVSLWPVGNVNWEVKLVGNGTNIPIPSVASPLQDGSTSWDEAFQKSIDKWNAVLPDNVLTLSITANSSIDPGNHDGVNNVGFMTTVYGSTWSSGVVGISISTWTGTLRTENDVLFNANKTWDAYDGDLQGNVTEFKRVALHELGHSLGADHPDDAGQVVDAIMNSVTGNLYVLQQDDIDGILSLYGSIKPITITKQPLDYSAPVGGTWPISITVTGSEMITYVWESSTDGGTNWSVVGGIDGPTWSYPNLQAFQDGTKVRATLTNDAGSIMSDVATLSVTASQQAPVITTQPGDASGDVGTNITFSVAATGSPSPTFKWQSSSNGGSTWSDVTDGPVIPDGYVYSGAKTSTLTIKYVATTGTGLQYRAIALNTFNSTTLTATSNPATLTVTGVAVAPTITTDPSSQAVNEGDPVSFMVVATGSGPLSYQWKKDGVAIGGQTSDTYNIASAAPAHEGSYTCVVSNSQGTATSSAATLTVTPAPAAPSITTQPSSLTVAQGAPASFTVVANGTPSPTYQWKKDGVDIGGATTDTYNIASAMMGDEGLYSVVVSNSEGNVTSNAAMLTVVVAPAITTQPISKAVAANGPVSFTVEASGGSLSYQWRKDGVNINGATSATYTIPNVTTGSAGTYSVVVSNAAGNITSADATLTVDTTPRMINLSTLTKAGSGNATLTVGFYIGGTGSKTLLIRGVGPSLVAKGVGDAVVDPQLALYSATSVLLDQNDNWDAALAPDFAAVGAFALDANSKDAAMKVTLTAGKSYSVQLVNTGTVGRALIEIYDFSRDAASRLTNLSCRLSISGGQIVTIGTYMLNGSEPILVRTSGPGLAYYLPAYFNISDVLPDPQQIIFRGGTNIDSNDNWDSALATYFNAVGAFPWENGSKDSAQRVVLSPGSYSVQAFGHGGTGIALIEFYESP